MTVAAVIERPRRLDVAELYDDTTHYVCEIHDELALCGEHIDPDSPTYDNDDPADCPLCGLASEAGVVCVIPDCPGERSEGCHA